MATDCSGCDIALDALASLLGGRSVRRTYSSLSPGANQPRLVVRPEVANEVVACMRCAADHGLSVSVVGGAHTPHCAVGDIVIELAFFKRIEVDVKGRTVTVGGGALAGEIQEAASSSGFIVPLGTAPTVGLGMILQGGVGHWSRRCGLAIDAILSAEVVTADGEHLHVTGHTEEETQLLWALRGCGTNFGVVLSLTLRIYPAFPLTVERHDFLVPAEISSAAELMLAYAARSAALPLNASADCHFYFDGVGALHFLVSDFSELDCSSCESGGVGVGLVHLPVQLLDHAIDAGIPPLALYDREPGLLKQPEGILLPPGSDSYGFFVRAVFLASPMSQRLAEDLVSHIQTAPCPHCHVQLQHVGGAVGDVVAAARSAFAARDAEWSVVLAGCWPKPAMDVSLADRCEEWVRGAVEVLLPSSLGVYGTDLGSLHIADKAWGARTFGSHQADLVRMKRIWDPQNVLRCGFPLAEAGVPAS
eukprot:TRINITY_DN50811_c0_g1_i1.p1 TRINITY_DN50811_c0_g1~~TRINITY_DN50811_c0_g1_i1.p1  ORF type:complete len:502 (-),score=81.05 TRINITY_DN50811_c0_g1_i1:52-1482(-)